MSQLLSPLLDTPQEPLLSTPPEFLEFKDLTMEFTDSTMDFKEFPPFLSLVSMSLSSPSTNGDGALFTITGLIASLAAVEELALNILLLK
jgi:hypothetical protein